MLLLLDIINATTQTKHSHPNIFFALSIHDWKQGSSNQKWINIGIKKPRSLSIVYYKII